MSARTSPLVRTGRVRRIALAAAPPPGAFASEAWPWHTPRQRDVFSRPRTVMVLVELLREQPRGACAVCWRNLSRSCVGGDDVACARKDSPLTSTSYCSSFIQSCLATARRKYEAAKASALAELEEGAGHA